MSHEFRMPSLGADMEDGTLVEWRVKPGAHVHKGDVVALVETVKGIIDVECFEDGIVEKLTVEPGTVVPVGTALALFVGDAAAAQPGGVPPVQVGAALAPAAAGAQPLAAPAREGAAPAPIRSPADAGRPRPEGAPAHARRISPAARVRAVALGVDPDSVHGTGPGGVITLQDIERAAAEKPATAAAPAAPSAAITNVAAGRSGMRNAIAASMSRSKREIPHYYLQSSMDLQPAVSWLENFNAARPVPERILMPVLLLKAVARSAAQKPGFNGYFTGAGFEAAPAVHLGVAIALRGGGLVAPAILEADRKPLATIMHELQDLVSRVRSGHMRSSEISSATLTVTSLGEEGADAVYPIIYPPQVAIVGFGTVQERPWVVQGRLEVRPVLNITLAADHRVSDGRLGAQFLARIRDWLSKPGEL